MRIEADGLAVEARSFEQAAFKSFAQDALGLDERLRARDPDGMEAQLKGEGFDVLSKRHV